MSLREDDLKFLANVVLSKLEIDKDWSVYIKICILCSSLEHFQEEFEDVSKEDQVSATEAMHVFFFYHDHHQHHRF